MLLMLSFSRRTHVIMPFTHPDHPTMWFRQSCNTNEPTSAKWIDLQSFFIYLCRANYIASIESNEAENNDLIISILFGSRGFVLQWISVTFLLNNMSINFCVPKNIYHLLCSMECVSVLVFLRIFMIVCVPESVLTIFLVQRMLSVPENVPLLCYGISFSLVLQSFKFWVAKTTYECEL